MVKYYSSIKDDDFEDTTCSKEEFKKYTWVSSNKPKPTLNIPKHTSLLPHQQWLANYIGPKTPYKGMLIYHETGTGKTCTAITIAENFRLDLAKKRKKVIVLCSDNIKDEFYRTISNPDPKAFKCTGDTYNEMIEPSQDMTQKNLNNKINTYYCFMTHQKFGKEVMNKVKKKNIINKKLVQQYYSGSVIIIDEAQHLRSKFDAHDKTDKRDIHEKLSHDAIDCISKYAEDVKIVFLTATPMYDTPTEIIWMINVLIRVNGDTCDELVEKDIFNETQGFTLKKSGLSKFIRAIRGKVSFLRSGNPSTFPLRLHDSSGTYVDIPTSFLGKSIQKNEKMDTSVKLTVSRMSSSHYEYIKKIRDETKTSGTGDSFHTQMMRLHNVKWYTKSKKNILDDDTNLDGAGLEKHFKITKNGLYTPLKSHNVLDNLEEYSPKINTIVKNILEMRDTGIGFIFSQFVSSGVIPMMLALEANGFSKYDGRSDGFRHLQMKNTVPDRGRYMVITSSRILSTTRLQEYINVSRSKGNESGQKIRVIIASGAGGEGLDLKWIRQVHIMEPHFHFSQIEQAVGRAIRNKSHEGLPIEKQNCTIFYHTTSYPKSVEMETVDMYLYRIKQKKEMQVIK